MEQKRTKLVKRKAPQYKIKVRGEKVKKTSLFYQDKREAKQNAGVSGLSSAYDDDAEQYWSSSETSPAETYEQRRKQLSEDWRQMEENLFSLRIISFKPASFLCNICRQSTKNIVRCSDCGIPSYFCKPCWLTFHENIYYHVPDIWNEHKSVFIKMEVPVKTLRRLDAHECETSYVKQMVVIDNKGFQHSIDATFCQCEVEPVTLLRWNLWPGSAKSPKVAFSIDYLEFLRVLMLGKQVSTEGFVNCMHLRYVPVIGYKTKIKNIARILLNEVMESYRHHVYKLQNAQLPELVTAGIDNGTECPCCYLDEKKTFYLDGNFGLVRRQTGHNSIQPHHKDLYFLEQTAVDEFVQQYTQRFYPKQDCSDFQAGSTVRSKNKNKKLSVNGVFGACCKHEIPTLFMNMKHGERFSYPVFIIRQLLLKCSSPITIFYDIACRIFAHLRLKQDTDILPLVKFVVPVFHGYGHNVNCQAQFSPRKTLQCGLADGEGMERLWSFLRNFNKISKEMKTEHRNDLLTDGLLLYADKQKKKLGLVLVQKLEKARAIQKESKERLRHMINAHSSIESFDDVKATADTWQHIPSIQIDSSEQLDYHEEYAMKVNTLRIERAVLENLKSDDPQKAHQSGQIARLEHEALMLEQRLKIPHRWGNANPDFRTYTLSAVNKIRSKLQRKISKLNMEAKFVSSLLKKYPVGQAISGRILKTLKRINKNIKITMQEYNKYSDLPPSPLPQTSKIDQVTMPDDDSGGKQDMVDCYNMLLRSQEEETFTLQEMKSALAFYHRQIELCTGCMEKIPSPYTPYVHTQIFIKKTHLRELITKFKMYIDVPSVISHIVESSQDDWCSYDIESDYETDSSVDE